MSRLRIRLLALLVIAAASLSQPRPAAAQSFYCGDFCISCACSGGGTYVCCSWYAGSFEGCAHHGTCNPN